MQIRRFSSKGNSRFPRSMDGDGWDPRHYIEQLLPDTGLVDDPPTRDARLECAELLTGSQWLSQAEQVRILATAVGRNSAFEELSAATMGSQSDQGLRNFS